MFKTILIANRGEIACRVMQTAQALGVRCIAVYSDADRNAKHVAMADEAYRLGPAPVNESYLKADAIIAAAKASGAEAIHPGYGFLSENPEFVEACEAAGITFIGPSASAIRAMGLKDAAKKLMIEAGVKVVPGYHADDQTPALLAEKAAEIGYPVLIKARAGGGGKGMRLVERAEDFLALLDSARREGESSFGDGHVLIEKYITSPRHIEVQVFGDRHGNVVHLFERDCSLQRRHQKVIEEAPAPGMTADMREAMGAAGVRAAQAVNYVGAGTVEFIVDASDGLQADRFYFMEMNTRLQVEHPVTEAITGQDLVEWQLRVASGESLPCTQDQLTINGHAFEARIYAEDVPKGFIPATGTLSYLSLPEATARVDSAVRSGDEITPFYDPMIAKLTVHGPTRQSALNAMASALSKSLVAGCVTNIGFLHRLTQHDDFAAGRVDTGLIERDLDKLIPSDAPNITVLAIAALAKSGCFNQTESNDPWATLSHWRQWGASTYQQTIHWQDKTIPVSITVDGQHFSVKTDTEMLSGSTLSSKKDSIRLDLGGHIVEAQLIQSAQTLTIFYQSSSWQIDLPDPLTIADAGAGSSDRITSPMPGQIKLVSAKTGDRVNVGDVLMVMEAMKMEHTLCAPYDAVIREITVEAGDQVEGGSVLILFESGT